MSNRFVQYRPLDYTPVTEPLEILKESLVNRRKLIDMMEDEQDKLATIQAKGIDGTDWQNKAVNVNKVLQSKKDEVSNYLMENSGDLYGAKRKIRELKNYITRESISGELGAINNASAAYAKRMEELQKEAGKKDSFSLSRLEKQNQLFKMQSQNLGKFNPIRGTYENATSLTAPPAEFDVYERLTDVIKNTSALTEYRLQSGRDGWQLVDRVTGVEHKDSNTLVANMLDSLKTSAAYKDDLEWQTRYTAVASGLDMSKPENQELMASWAAQKMANDAKGISGYAYTKEMAPTIHRTNDPEMQFELQRRRFKHDDDKLAGLMRDNSLPGVTVPVDFIPANASILGNIDLNNEAVTNIINKYTKNGRGSNFFDAGTYFDEFGISYRDASATEPNYVKNPFPGLTNLPAKDLQNLANELQSKQPNFNKDKFIAYMEKQSKNLSKSASDKIKDYFKNFEKETGTRPQEVRMIPFSLDNQQYVTANVLMNDILPVTVVKNGKIVHNGENFTMGDLKKKYGENIFDEKTRKTVNALNPNSSRVIGRALPSSISNNMTLVMTLPNGMKAYIQDGLNSSSNRYNPSLQTANELRMSKQNPANYANGINVGLTTDNSTPVQELKDALQMKGIQLPSNIQSMKLVPGTPFEVKNIDGTYSLQPSYKRVVVNYVDNGRMLSKEVYNAEYFGGSELPLNEPDNHIAQQIWNQHLTAYGQTKEKLTKEGQIIQAMYLQNSQSDN